MPQEMRARLIRLHGAAGGHWFDEAPELVRQICSDHRLILGKQLDSYEALVFEGRSEENGGIILKLGFPKINAPSLAACLAFADHGGVPILFADVPAGFSIMPRIEGGTSVLDMFFADRDDDATLLAAQTIHRLRSAPLPNDITPFRRVADKMTAFSNTSVLPAAFSQRAVSIFKELLTTSPAPVLLHGDLHHGNLLTDAEGMAYCIDPKGVIGDPTYEVGAWMRNPMDLHEHPDPTSILARRFDIFAEVLGDNRQRMQNWCFVQMALATLWLMEDEQKTQPRAVEFAELMLKA